MKFNLDWAGLVLSNKEIEKVHFMISWTRLTDSIGISRKESYEMLTEQDDWNTTKEVSQ